MPQRMELDATGVNASSTMDTQGEVAIHCLACISLHDTLLSREQEDGTKVPTLRELVGCDRLLRSSTNLCVAELLCTFGRQAKKPFYDVASARLAAHLEDPAEKERYISSLVMTAVRTLIGDVKEQRGKSA